MIDIDLCRWPWTQSVIALSAVHDVAVLRNLGRNGRWHRADRARAADRVEVVDLVVLFVRSRHLTFETMNTHGVGWREIAAVKVVKVVLGLVLGHYEVDTLVLGSVGWVG